MSKTTFQQYAAEWQRVFCPAVKPASAATFASHVRRLNEILGDAALADLRSSTVQEALNRLGTRLSPRTIHNIAGTLSNVLHRAQQDGLIATVPTPRLPDLRETRQPWYNVVEVQRLVRGAAISCALLAPLVYLLAETGLRIGEAVGLTIDDINLTNGTLTVDKSVWRGQVGTTKCQSSDRKLSISKHLQGILSEPLADCPKNAFVFRTATRKPMWPSAISNSLRDVAAQQGIKWHGPHALRRTNATIMADLGVPEPIADMRQGHRHARGLTYGLYSQRAGLQDREWAEKIAETLQGCRRD